MFRRPRHPWRIICILLAVVALLYVGPYIVLSARGGYRWSASGELRWVFDGQPGLAVLDRVIWHPRGIHWERYRDLSGQRATRADGWGQFYCPLIVVDRWLVHRTYTRDELGTPDAAGTQPAATRPAETASPVRRGAGGS